MAAPTVADADTTTGTQSSASTTWTLTYPANIAEGDLLLAFVASNPVSAQVNSVSAGWIRNASVSGVGGDVFKKKATGSESGTFTVGFSANATGHWVVYRIPANEWDGNIGEGWLEGWQPPGSGAGGSVIGAGTSSNDPPVATSAYWGSESDVLWIACLFDDANSTITGFPSGYTNTYSVNDANGGTLGIARKAATGSDSENPGTFTLSAGNAITFTIGIRGNMGFPVIHDADSKAGTVVSNSTSWTLTYPTNLQSGDLIVAFVSSDGANIDTTFPANWVNAGRSDSGANCMNMAKKISDGTETGNFTVNLSATEQGAWFVLRITDWEGTLGTTFGNGASSDGATARAFQSAGGGSPSTTPNPPNLDPFNWDVEKTLWIATCSVDTSRTISVWPFTDRNHSGVSGGAGGATLGFCTSFQEVASVDPSTFTISTSDDWTAGTIAIRPAAAAVAAPGPVLKRKAAHRFLAIR